MSTVLKKLTWEDIKDLPESHGRTELVDGELVVSPTPSLRHQTICDRLAAVLGDYVHHRGLGHFFGRPVHVILSEHVHYEPDLCFIANDRRLELDSPYFEGAPDLIIEVISECNRSHDTVVKYRDYERFGVREYWIVDPREEHIRVFVREGGAYRTLGVFSRGEPVRSHVLEGVTLDPAAVF
ncbi:MAG: Uma2 family endonuclease [Bryobacterales bacterium]|nr:Uma2 family endonuclease [Bryobacterales bacterium]